MLTTDKNDPRLGHGVDEECIPQHEVYLVLSDEERAKGFVRSVRRSYTHVGKKVELEGGTLEPLTPEDIERYAPWNYVALCRYPESRSQLVGKMLTQKEVDNIGKYVGGCGTVTTMGQSLAETYARDPKFYGSTYCCCCQKHLAVDEFVWTDTDEIVGS